MQNQYISNLIYDIKYTMEQGVYYPWWLQDKHNNGM